MASNTGLMTVSAISFFAPKTPNGIPISMEIRTATSIIATVTIVGSHKFTIAKRVNPITQKIPIL